MSKFFVFLRYISEQGGAGNYLRRYWESKRDFFALVRRKCRGPLLVRNLSLLARACAKRTFYDEMYMSFGDANPDKTFYVIRISVKGYGLFAAFYYVMSHLYNLTTTGRNVIPVIDLENFKTVYNELDPINGSYNAWEYFFEQPSRITLDEVYRSMNVVFSSNNRPFDFSKLLYSNEYSKMMCDLIITHAKFNKPTIRLHKRHMEDHHARREENSGRVFTRYGLQ